MKILERTMYVIIACLLSSVIVCSADNFKEGKGRTMRSTESVEGYHTQHVYVDGTATSAKQDTGNTTLSSILANQVHTDIEGGGKVSVGVTAVEVTFTGVPKSIAISADKDNTGVLYIGESNVTVSGTNSLIFLQAGESFFFDYNDATNPVYVVGSTQSQYFYKGATL